MINKYEIAQAVCIGMIMAGVVGIAGAMIVPHAEAATLYVSTMSHTGGEVVSVNGTINTSFVLAPCGISDISVPAGTYIVSMKGNAGLVETSVVHLDIAGTARVQFIGQANPTIAGDVKINNASKPTITPPPEPTPTPTKKPKPPKRNK